VVFPAIVIGSAITSVLSYKDYTVFSLATILPLLAAGARRLHDTNKSGWLQLLGLAPLACSSSSSSWHNPSLPPHRAKGKRVAILTLTRFAAVSSV
jgi:uncharacterized membrane protein YhaH (DUF805 family)